MICNTGTNLEKKTSLVKLLQENMKKKRSSHLSLIGPLGMGPVHRQRAVTRKKCTFHMESALAPRATALMQVMVRKAISVGATRDTTEIHT
jgi:hypothetical protein